MLLSKFDAEFSKVVCQFLFQSHLLIHRVAALRIHNSCSKEKTNMLQNNWNYVRCDVRVRIFQFILHPFFFSLAHRGFYSWKKCVLYEVKASTGGLDLNPVQVEKWMKCLLGLEIAVSVETTAWQRLCGKEENKTAAEGSFWEHRYASFFVKCMAEKEFCNMKLTEKDCQEICTSWWLPSA